MLVFSSSTRTRSQWWKFSAMLTGQPTGRQDALSQELQFSWWMFRLFKLQDTENRVTFERRVRNICSCVSHHGCDLDHNHLFMASPMSLHDVFVSGFISGERCSFSQRCRSFEAFVMQDLVDAGLGHGKAFTGESSDGSTQPCRHCHKETQRSKARVVVLLFGYLERKQSGRSP